MTVAIATVISRQQSQSHFSNTRNKKTRKRTTQIVCLHHDTLPWIPCEIALFSVIRNIMFTSMRKYSGLYLSCKVLNNFLIFLPSGDPMYLQWHSKGKETHLKVSENNIFGLSFQPIKEEFCKLICKTDAQLCAFIYRSPLFIIATRPFLQISFHHIQYIYNLTANRHKYHF